MLIGQWSSADIAPRDQFGFVRDLLLSNPVPVRMERAGVPHDATFRSASWVYAYGPDVAVVRNIGEAAAGFRGAPEIARGAPAMTWILQYRDAGGEMVLDGKPYWINPGDMLYGDCGVEQMGTGAAHVDFTMWMLPTAWLTPLLVRPEHDPKTVLKRSSPLGRLAGDYLANLQAALENASPDLQERLLGNLLNMLALGRGLSPHEEEPAMHSLAQVRLEHVKRDVDASYADPSLSPAVLARRHRMSLRALHLLFEPSGTSCARFILDKRLAATHHLLSDPGGNHRTVADIAFACGFDSLSTFHRNFRARYGHTPADLRG